MIDLSKLTAKDFSDAMHKGWEKREWCAETFAEDDDFNLGVEFSAACRVCAIGAMAGGLGVPPNEVCDALDRFDITMWNNIATASDEAGNKRAAMKAVDAILLNTHDYLAVKK